MFRVAETVAMVTTERESIERQINLLDDDVKRTARNVTVSPFDDQDVIPALGRPVDNGVLTRSNMSDRDLLTWNTRPTDTNEQHTATWKQEHQITMKNMSLAYLVKRKLKRFNKRKRERL